MHVALAYTGSKDTRGQERAHWTFNNEILNGWSCVIKWTKLCHSYLLRFSRLFPFKLSIRRSLSKDEGIKFAQSIRHVLLLCWNINRASNLKATRRNPKNVLYPQALFRPRSVSSFVAVGKGREGMEWDVVNSFDKRFVRCAILKSSSDVINDS